MIEETVDVDDWVRDQGFFPGWYTSPCPSPKPKGDKRLVFGGQFIGKVNIRDLKGFSNGEALNFAIENKP